MSPTQAIEGCELKQARLALITTKQVGEVCCTEQRGVHAVNDCACGVAVCVLEINVALSSQAKHRSEVAANTQTNVRIHVLQPCVTCSLGSKATVYTYVDVVESFAFKHSLCRNCCSGHEASKQSKYFFH